jgi:hypothetical protein
VKESKQKGVPMHSVQAETGKKESVHKVQMITAKKSNKCFETPTKKQK